MQAVSLLGLIITHGVNDSIVVGSIVVGLIVLGSIVAHRNMMFSLLALTDPLEDPTTFHIAPTYHTAYRGPIPVL